VERLPTPRPPSTTDRGNNDNTLRVATTRPAHHSPSHTHFKAPIENNTRRLSHHLSATAAADSPGIHHQQMTRTEQGSKLCRWLEPGRRPKRLCSQHSFQALLSIDLRRSRRAYSRGQVRNSGARESAPPSLAAAGSATSRGELAGKDALHMSCVHLYSGMQNAVVGDSQ